MSLDKQLFANMQKHDAEAPSRFRIAQTLLMGSDEHSTAQKPSVETKAKVGGIRIYMSQSDDATLDKLVRQAGLQGIRSSRSEIVRAGIHLLAALDPDRFATALASEQAPPADKPQGMKA